MPSLPRNLSGEVITVARDISKSLVAFGNSRVLSTDDVLLGRGGGQYKAYEDLLKDGHCKSVIQKRQLAVIAREWQVEPASSSAQDKKAADMVSAQLKALATKVSADALGVGGFDSTCLNFLDATLKGFAVGETIWGFDGSEIYASEVKPRNQQIFSFGISKETEDYELRLLTLQDMVFGVPLVKDYPRKFIVHTFGSKDGNPLGVGLGQVLWWPVFFKKQGIKFWLQFVDKFAAPTAVAKYSKGATEKQKQEILAALEAIATDAGIALPEGVEIMLLEAARSGSIDTYERLCKYMDTEMSKATLGETLSTDIGERGSYAASQTHNEVRKELVKADADLLSDTLNRTLVRWITELNLPSAKPPRVWRNFEEAEDLNTRVSRDKTLFDMGFRLKLAAVTEIYGDHYELMQKEEPQKASVEVGDEEFLKNSGVQSNESDESADMSETADFGSIIDRVLKWNGLAIGVEFLPNQVRFPGRKHSKKLRSGYGHIRGTKGADGEALDCYIYPGLLKDEPEGSDRIFQVTQVSSEDGDFDEHKFMIGYTNLKAAKEAYLQEMPIEFFGGIQEVTIEGLEQYKRTPISLSTSQSLPIAPNFAEQEKDAPELYAEQLQERTAPVISSWLGEVRSLVQKSESFEEVRDSLFDLFPQLNTADFTQLMAEAMMASEAAGRWEVINESGVEFAEAPKTPRQLLPGGSRQDPQGVRQFLFGGTTKTGLPHRTASITDKQSLLDLRSLLESSYTDGITAIKAYINEEGNIEGTFEDKISPQLTKKLKFEITDDEKIYSLLNPSQVSNFVESTPVDFAAATKSCKKGVPCGGSCIAANKTCRSQLTPPQKTTAAAIKSKATSRQNVKTTSASAAANAKPTSVATSATTAPSRNPAIKTNDTELDTKRKDLEKRFGKQAVEDAEKNVKRILSDPDVAVHVRVGSSATLELILGDRFKTSAELGIDTHQIPYLKGGYQDARNRVEAKSLGYPEKGTKPEDRPIYGYLGGKDLKGTSHADVSQAYGSITVKLKEDVKDRSTFTGADSFKSGIASDVKNPNAAAMVSSTRHGFDKDSLPAGYPANYADKSGDKGQLTAAAKAKNIDDLASGLSPTGNRYVEAQIHGKVTPKDIAEIHFEPKGASDRPTAAIAKFAKDNGVDLYVGGKKLSSKELDDIVTPPKDRRSQRIKDLDNALAKGDFGKVADLTEKIHEDAQKVNLAPGERDKYLKHLYTESGYDEKPKVVSKKDIDDAAANGATLATRGVAAGTKNRTEYLDQYQNGDYFTGNGIYGNGTYVGHSGDVKGGKFKHGNDTKSAKRAWGDVAKHGYIEPNGVTMRMAIPKDANIITAKEQAKEIADTKAKVKKWAQAERQKIQASGNKYQASDVAKVDTEAKNVEANYVGKLGKSKKQLISDDGLGTREQEHSIPVKGDKPITFKIREDDDFFSGKTRYSYTDSSGTSTTFKTQKAAIEAATKDFYRSTAAKNLGYDEVPTVGNNSAKVAQKLKDFDAKVNRMEAVLYGDEGSGSSGRFGVIKGHDAVALDNSYEPKSFMNLLNRSKVMIQKDELTYKDGQAKGVAP